MRAHPLRPIAAVLLLVSAPAAADEIVLDLHAALARAAEVAPAAVAARGRIGEAEAGRASAVLGFTSNPELEIEAGPRLGPERGVQIAGRLGQSFGPPGSARARRAVTEATVGLARASAGAAVREVQLDAALAFYEALHADRVAGTALGAEALAQRAAEAADRRRRAGDLTDLDADLARIALGRARSATRAAQAERAMAIGRLAALLSLDPGDTLVLRGELRPAEVLPAAIETLPPTLAARADLRALEAEAGVAVADLRLARASGRPELGLWLGYERDAGADIVLGGVRLTLPIWDRAQRARAEARARSSRVAAERTAAVRAASRQIADAIAAYQRAREAVEIFEADVLPVLDDSERLLERSVAAGQLAVADYLVARRELLDGRREHLDRLLAMARADVIARFAGGVTP